MVPSSTAWNAGKAEATGGRPIEAVIGLTLTTSFANPLSKLTRKLVTVVGLVNVTNLPRSPGISTVEVKELESNSSPTLFVLVVLSQTPVNGCPGSVKDSCSAPPDAITSLSVPVSTTLSLVDPCP